MVLKVYHLIYSFSLVLDFIYLYIYLFFFFLFFIIQNLSYECAYNDDDFGIGPVENNNRTYYSPETHHSHLAENAHKTIRIQQHNPLQSDHPKDTAKKKKYSFFLFIVNITMY